MRVLMFEPTGGFWPYADDVADFIAAQGVEVTLLTSRSRMKDVAQAQRSYQMAAVARPMNPKFHPGPHERAGRCLWAADRLISASQWLLARSSLARTLRPDVVHVQSTIPMLDQYVLPRFAKRHRVVMTVHDVLPITETRSVGSKRALQRVYRCACHLIVHSGNCRQELIQFAGVDPGSVSVIPHGVRPASVLPGKAEARARLGLPENDEIVLMFGGIRKSKGLDLAIRALAEAAKCRPHLRLLVAGSAPRDGGLNDYRRIAEETKVRDRVEWRIGFIPEGEVPYYFRASDLVLLPYTLFHSQSGVLLQAYKYGVPVVTTDVGALGETVRADGTGVVADSLDPSALARELAKLLDTPELLTRYSANALAKVAGPYNWANVARQTIEIYRRVVAV